MPQNPPAHNLTSENVEEGVTEAVNFRVPRTVKERLRKAAEETDLPMADWMRHVLLSALDLHEQSEPEPDDAADEDEEPESWDLLQARVRQEERARQLVAEEQAAAGRRQPPARKEHVKTRDCPHLPSMWRGSRCRCGVLISRVYRVQPSSARR